MRPGLSLRAQGIEKRIDYDATFYFKNDDGDVESKSACGTFDGITSSYISAGDVEYRHGYMLGDYEK